ncbi:unnamed protein product [Camellia sinensis]
MAEGIGFSCLGKALGGIGEYLVAPICRQFGYLFCFNTNIQNLETQLDSLKVTREGVQLGVDETRNNVRTVGPHLVAWLTKANDNTAEAETIIKDKAQVQKGCFNGWCPNLKLRYSLGREVVKKTQELALLHGEGSNYTQSSYNPPPSSIQPIPTTTEFQGFDSRILVMNEIIEALEDDGIHLIGICGMGGMGKTTMAKEVAKRTKNLFNEFPMAVVSQEPDLTKVQGCIADMLGLKLDDRESPIARASLLRKRLVLDNKKILVILDDVWAEFDLEDLGFPLGRGSNKSCKILFTSRNRNIWKGIQNKRYIQLQVLVGDEPWHLFREKVGDCADKLDLLPLAKDIVNECGGLPLALVTMGSTLMNEHKQYHWKDALRQLRTPCSESLLSEVPAKVYQALYFSYNFLQDERAKKLFLLCCLFPEDYGIPIEDLVRYGIGLRWFEGIDKVDEVRDRVNVLVDQLKSCYLLLDGDEEAQIKMHDVVRDVAISIAAKDKHGFMTIHGAKSREWPKKATYELNTSISVISGEIVEFPGGLRCSKLEFLLIQCWNWSLKVPSNFFEGMGELKVLDLTITRDISLLPSSLQFLSNLLTLHLDYCKKFDNISVIGKLLNMEILWFRDSDIEELPEEIGGLVNLKLLDLTGCNELKRIAPGVISALVQLQELYMGGCKIIWEREGKEGGENASLREFDYLSNLNTLEINIEDVKCLPRIPLFSKLTKYSISIGYYDDEFFGAEQRTSFGNHLKLKSPCTIPLECVNSLLRSSAFLELRGMGSEDAVQELFREGVEGLQHLKDLVINDCVTPECFVNTMEWVPRTPNAISPIFPILENLGLFALPNLRKICHCQLPTGSFGKLKHLHIYDCDKIEEVIWNEKVEDDATNKMEFPALESMTLFNLPMLIGFCRGIDEIEFPQLKELSLGRLPQLKRLFLNSSNPFSESMENHNATFLSLSPHKVALPSLEQLQLNNLDNLEGLEHIPISVGSFSKRDPIGLKYISQLSILRVHDCNNLRYLFPHSMMKCMLQLQELDTRRCKMMSRILADGKGHGESSVDKIEFTELKILRLYDLPNLESFFPKVIATSATSTERLQNVMRTLFNEKVSMMQCILQLQELEIRGCKMISAIVREEDSQGEILVDNIEFTQLKIHQLYDLQNLVSIFPKVTTIVVTSFEHIQNPGQSLFNEVECSNDTRAVAFPSLEELELHGFQNMNEIWCNQLQTGSFNKLIKLDVSDCGSLRNMFSPFMARHLVHLERLVIIRCSMMEEVVAKEEEEGGRINRTPLPKLEYLELKDLPELKSFCHITHDWELPLVEHITILKCPKLKTFPGVMCTPKLRHVCVEGRVNRYLVTERRDCRWISDRNLTIPHQIEV